jgi:beta-lactamase superfamily II metal-dependent hydrolase
MSRRIHVPIALALSTCVLVLLCGADDTRAQGEYSPATDCTSEQAEDLGGDNKNAEEGSASKKEATVTLETARKLVITTLNVGAGACHVVTCPGENGDGKGEAIVLDCGSTSAPRALSSVAVINRVMELLENRRVHIVLSHADLDHYKYIPAIIRRVPIDGIASLSISGITREYSYKDANGAAYDALNFVAQVAKQDSRVEFRDERYFNGQFDIRTGMLKDDNKPPQLNCGSATVSVVAAPTLDKLETPKELDKLASGTKSTRKKYTNQRSLIALVGFGEFQALFPGDATTSGQLAAKLNTKRFRTRGMAPIEFLSASHHGSEKCGSNNRPWIEAVKPRVAVFTSGVRSKSNMMTHGHPTKFAFESIRNGMKYHPLGVELHLVPHCEGTGKDKKCVAEAINRPIFNTAYSGNITVAGTADGVITDLSCDGDHGLDTTPMRDNVQSLCSAQSQSPDEVVTPEDVNID